MKKIFNRTTGSAPQFRNFFMTAFKDARDAVATQVHYGGGPSGGPGADPGFGLVADGGASSPIKLATT